MSIAPLAALGIAKTAFSIIGSLADAVRRPSVEPAGPGMTAMSAQESPWHQIGRDVDVNSMSREDLAKISAMLYDQGLISLSDHATMSFDPSFAGSSNLLTAADGSGRVDWMAEFQARMARHSAEGDTSAAAQDERVLGILSRLQAGSRGVTSIRV
jgi:hypothetical protein